MPAQAPVALEAAIQACTVSLAPIAWAEPVWSLPKSTQEEVADPVIKVPMEPMKAATRGYMVPVTATAVRASSKVMPLWSMTLAVAMTVMIVTMVKRKLKIVLFRTPSISPMPAPCTLPPMKAARKIRMPGVFTQVKV